MEKRGAFSQQPTESQQNRADSSKNPKEPGLMLPKDKARIKNLEQEQIYYEHKIKEIDGKIVAIQNSTRTLFKPMVPTHDFLRRKSKLYYKWHCKPYSGKIHWGILGFYLIAIIFFLSSILAPSPALAGNVTWDGEGTDGDCGGVGTANNWSCDKNWSGDSAPGNGDVAIFDDTSTKDCTIDSAVDVAGIDINSNYTGTITQSSSVTVTVGASNYDQADGVFVGSDANIDVNGSFTISSGSFTSTSATLSINDSYDNSGGTFTHNSGLVTFDATDAGNTLSGNMTDATSSQFYKIKFDGASGEWSINDPMLVAFTSGDGSAAFSIGDGTVTMGDGAGDNLEIDGKMTIATTSGETGTFQTYEVPQADGTITFDMNDNNGGSPPACPYCIIQVGTTGADSGQGNLKIKKNTILRLNPNSSSSDTGIEVEKNGYLEIQGSQDYAGTNRGTDSQSLRETKICDDIGWSDDENNGKVVRMTSGLAFGKIYDITDTIDGDSDCDTDSDDSIVRADNTSVTDTDPVVSGSGPTRTLTLSNDNLITANDQGVGRYAHTLDGDDEYFKIADSAEAASDTLTVIAEPAANFTNLATGDDIEITDGVSDIDTYEVLDYATVTAEAGTVCNATLGQSYEAYIYGKQDSENVIRYADICNLGSFTENKTGINFDDINGADASEGITVDRLKYTKNYGDIHVEGSSNNNSGNSKGITNNYLDGALLSGAYPIISLNNNSDSNTISYNHFSHTKSHRMGVWDNCDHNTISYNKFYDPSSKFYGIGIQGDNNIITHNEASNDNYGMSVQSCDNNIIASNQFYNMTITGINTGGAGSDNNIIYSNETFLCGWNGIALQAASLKNTLFNNVAYRNTNTSYGAINIYGGSSYTTAFGNQSYSNAHGLELGGQTIDNFIGINEDYGSLGANTSGDVWYYTSFDDDHKAKFYNTKMASSTEVSNATLANQYVISRKHDNTAGATRIWNDYAVSADDPETPQDESTDQFNYVNNLWPDSFTGHGYRVGYGAGTEDSDLDYGINGSFGGDGSVYNYYITCTAGNCVTTPDSWDVYRNGILLTDPASTGVTYTDDENDGGSAPNIQFKIDDAGTDYTAGATYTFTAWKASGDTNTTKTVTMVRSNDTFTVGSGKTLESIGDTSHRTSWIKGTGGAGVSYRILGTGTFDLNYSDFNFLGITGIDIQSGATVIDLSNINFLNDGGTTDTFVQVDSSVIDSSAKTFDGDFFADTGGVNLNVNRTGSDDLGYWRFTGESGGLAGESFDGKDGADEADPGMIQWTDSGGISISGSCLKYDESTPCADSETVKYAINGFPQAQTGTTSSGSWTISGALVNSGDIVTVWVDGVADDLEANAVTKYDGSGNITGVLLYEEHLTIGSDDNQTITNANLSSYDNSVSSNEDIFFDVDGNNDLTVDALSQSSQEKLYIVDMNTYRPDSGSSGDVYTHDIRIVSLNLTPDNNNIYVSGSWQGGLNEPNGSTVEMTSANSETVNYGLFYNFIHSGAGKLTVNSSLFIKNNFSNTNGEFDLNDAFIEMDGDYSNTGTLTAGTTTIYFVNNDSETHTLSGDMTGASAFYAVSFGCVVPYPFWTIEDPIEITATIADALDVYGGTVTLGDSPGDNLLLHGGLYVAHYANRTAIFQTAPIAQDSGTIIVDINDNNGGSPPACDNCIIQVGADSGSGQGSLKIRKNTILRLNRNSTSSNAGIEVSNTGYLEIQGSQDYAGANRGTDSLTLDETKICDDIDWSDDENNGKVVRMTSGLAFGKIYDIDDTIDGDSDCDTDSDDSIVRADNSSNNSTIASISGSGPTRKVCASSNDVIGSTFEEGVGRYLHDSTNSTGYLRIVNSTNNDASCSSNDSFMVINEPNDYSIMANGDSIDISDGVSQDDTYEILDYAHVTAEAGTACTATGGTFRAYIHGGQDSESIIRYADICDMGKNEDYKYGVSFNDIDGSTANEGITVEKSRIKNGLYNLYIKDSLNNNTSYSKGITNNEFSNSSWEDLWLKNSDNTDVLYNNVYDTGSGGLEMSNSNNNNFSYNQFDYGEDVTFLSMYSDSDNNTISNNQVFRADFTGAGVYTQNTSDNNLVYNNDFIIFDTVTGASIWGTNNLILSNRFCYSQWANGIHVYGSNNFISSNKIHDNYVGICIGSTSGSSSNNVFNNNETNRNTEGLYIYNNVAADTNTFINNNFGGQGANTTSDISVPSAVPSQAHKYYLYNTVLASTEISGAGASGMSGFSIISRKHDSSAGATRIWNDYSVPADNPETPQDESTDQFNYTNGLWPDSFTAHGYNVGYGAGSEDGDLDYGINGSFGGDGSVYNYYITCTAANCVTTADSWDVYRNGTLLTKKADTDTLYTDDENDGGSAPNIQFQIDDAGTDYTAGATYTFTAWKASDDTDTDKTVTMMQDNDTFTVGDQETLQSIGTSGHETSWTQGSSGGYNVTVEDGGTINSQYTTWDYLKGTLGIDIQAGATVTSLDNSSFDNMVDNATDAFITVASSVIDAAAKTLTAVNFDNTGSGANCNVNRTGSDDSGHWNFTGAGGGFAGEANDCKEGSNEADPGMIWWDESEPAITISGNCKQYDQSSNCANGETIKYAINGSPRGEIGITSDGNWSIANAAQPSNGDIITVWVDGVADDLEANAVAKYDGAGDISGINLYEEHLTLGSDDNQTITNADISNYDNSVSGNEDIFFDADQTHELTVDFLSQSSQEKLFIKANNTFQPGADTNTHDLEILGTVTADDNTFNVSGSWTNSGAFDDGTSIVNFTSTSGGEIVTGNLSGANSFYKISFNGIGGSWTIENSMEVTFTSGDASAAFNIGNGTVTMGDEAGDDLEVDGKMVIAGNADQTGTFQTAEVAQTAGTITFDMNDNNGGSPPACANCIIQVGADSGSGQGNLKLRKNTTLRLNPNGTSSDTGIEVEATGYLEIQGSQDYTGTSDGTTNETTITDTGKGWVNNENQNKVVRITSGLAFGKIYNIDSNDATTLTRTDNSSADSTITSFTDPGSIHRICVADIISSNYQVNGSYLHDKTHEGYLKIVGSWDDNDSCVGTDDRLDVVAEPDSFAILANGDTFDISDGVRQNDTYEILDYAKVQAESDTCEASNTNSYEGYVWAKSGSENLVRYADVCDLGRNSYGKNGFLFQSVNGSVANQGLTVEKSRMRSGNVGLFIYTSSNNSTGYGKGINNNEIYSNSRQQMFVYSSTSNTISNNNIYNSANYDGILLNASNSNTLNGNITYNFSKIYYAGIYLYLSNTNILTSNIGYKNSHAIILEGSNNNTFSSNSTFGNVNHSIYLINNSHNNIIDGTTACNQIYGIYIDSGNNNLIRGSIMHFVFSAGFWIKSNNNYFYNNEVHNSNYAFRLYTASAINNTFVSNKAYNSTHGIYADSNTANSSLMQNQSYSNSYGLYLRALNTLSINDDLGGSGENTVSDLYFDSNNSARFYNTNFASGTELSGPAMADGSYVASYNHDNIAGATKIWNDYVVPDDIGETPQDESTNQFNYTDNSWLDSFAPHRYNIGYGAGGEDSNLNYGINGSFGGDGSVYSYWITCTATNCVSTPNSWDVYRNGVLLTDPASTGVQYTDDENDGGSAPNIQFQIDDAGTDYTKGATYSFTAWKASGDTNTDKTVTMMQDDDTFTVGDGKTLETIGTSGHETSWTRGSSGGYNVTVENNGTLDSQYTTWDYLKGTLGLSIEAGATVDSLDHSSFDNMVNSGTDAFITVASSVIGAATKTITGVNFDNSGGGANFNVNRTGADDVGYWDFDNSTGTFDGEANDGKDGGNEDDPGMLQWDDSTTSTPAAPTIGTCSALSTSSIRWRFTDNASNETGFRVHDNGHVVKATCPFPNLSFCDEIGLSTNSQFTRHVHAYNVLGDSSGSANASCYTLSDPPANPTAEALSTSSIKLDWDSGGSQTKYKVYRDGPVGSGTLVYSDTNNSYTDTNLSQSKTYTYYIYSVNGDDLENVAFISASAKTFTKSGKTPDDTISPIAVLSGPDRAVVNTEVTFYATGSTDNDRVDSFTWDFGDNTSEKIKNREDSDFEINKTFSVTGSYLIVLQVADKRGNKSQASHSIDIVPPPPTIESIDRENSNLKIVGQATPDSQINLYLQSDQVILGGDSDSGGNWSIVSASAIQDLGGGGHTAYATVTDNHNMTSDPSETSDFDIGPEAKKPEGIIDIIEDFIKNIFNKVAEFIKDIIDTIRPTIEKAVPVILAITLAAVALALIYLAVGISLWNLVYFWYLFNALLEFIGLKEKRKPWGVVYDAKTKAPVPLAIVRIFDKKTRKLLETRVTDPEGRFGFLVPVGRYYITVTKNGYVYASKIIKPGTRADDVYTNLYHGAVLAIKSPREVVNVDIPVDPVKEKPPKTLLGKLKKSLGNRKFRIFIKKFVLPFLIVSLVLNIVSVICLGSWYNIAFIVVIGILIYKDIKDRLDQTKWGVVYDAETKKRIKGAILSLYDEEYHTLKETKTSDVYGRYGFLVPPGTYMLEVSKAGYSFPSQRIKTKNDPPFHFLYHGGEIAKPQPDAFVAANIAMDPVAAGKPKKRTKKSHKKKKSKK